MFNERLQPVVKGIDEKGELIWDFVPMSRWQMLMFPLRYFGDFMAFWIRRKFYDETGAEFSEDLPSMTIQTIPWKKKTPRITGD